MSEIVKKETNVIDLASLFAESDKLVRERKASKNPLISELDFNLVPGNDQSTIKVVLEYVPAETIDVLVDKHLKVSYKTDEYGARHKDEVLNNDAFINELLELSLKDIRGLTLGKMKLILFSEKPAKEDNVELPFTMDNGKLLAKKLPLFGTFIYNQCKMIDNFRKGDMGAELGN